MEPTRTNPVAAPRVVIPPRPTAPAQGGLVRQFGGAGIVPITPTGLTAVPVVNIAEQTGYTVLFSIAESWNGNDAKARELAALRYPSGQPIVDIKRRDVLNEIVGMLKYMPYEDVVLFLSSSDSPEEVLWDQDALTEARVAQAREITILKAEDAGVKGVGKCRFCGSTELVFAQKQLRGGDEPMTVFVRCVMCNKQWRN